MAEARMPNTLFDALFAPLAGRTDPLLILPDGQTLAGARATGLRRRSQSHRRRWRSMARRGLGAVFCR
jgi:hypothetical protein